MVKEKYRQEVCIVVYFDIYGFSEMVKMAPYPGKNKKGPAYQKDIKLLMDSLLGIWGWIELNIKKQNVFTYLFSDCAFLLYPIRNAKPKDIINQCMEDLELLMDKYLQQGFFLKGSVSYGNVFHTNNLLIGEPVVEAVRTESICPGPFIIFPGKELSKLIETEVFINEIKTLSVLQTKNQTGKLECCIIFPPDKGYYLRKIDDYAKYFLTFGPPEYAKFWHDTSEFLTMYVNKEML